MKILFIGGLYAANLKDCFAKGLKKTSLQNAPDTFQWALVEGFFMNGADFYVHSYPWLPCFPHHYKYSRIPSGSIEYNGKIIGESFSYSSVVAYKEYSIRNQVKKNVLSWIRMNVNTGEQFVILTYTPEPFYIIPLVSIKKQYPNMVLASIVTDLVDDLKNFESTKTLLKRIQCEIITRNTKKNYKFIDKYILLTKLMVEKIPEAKDRNIVIEGIYRNSDTILSCESLPKTILYTGVLEEFAGVRMLVDSFILTKDPSYKLIICGSGPLEEYIRKMSSKDSRIDFRGSIPRNEAISLQKSVSLLINPRQPNGGITKYSFPSKTMEYLSSGTPMIGYRLEGIPSDYYKYIFTPKDLSADALSETIDTCLKMTNDCLLSFGSAARSFILNHKSALIQVGKILSFLEER